MSTESPGPPDETPDGKALTLRQLQVISGLLGGLTCKEMAAQLNISPQCVKFHIGRIYRKYAVADRQSLLLRFGRFEIDVRWVPTPQVPQINS